MAILYESSPVAKVLEKHVVLRHCGVCHVHLLHHRTVKL